MLGDMGMTRMMGGDARLGADMMLRAVPAALSAGTVTFVVTNMGWRTHELVILPLGAGASAGQRVPGPDGRIDETAASARRPRLAPRGPATGSMQGRLAGPRSP